MGIASSIINKLRGITANSNEVKSDALKRGDDFVRYQQPGPHGTGYQQLSDDLRLDNDLMARFADYEEMSDYPEIASCVDVYADDATTISLSEHKRMWVTSPDEVVKLVLTDLLDNRLRIEDHIWSSTRNLCKYGNTYGEILATKEGVVGINYLPTPTVRRSESKKGSLIGFVQDPKGQFNLTNAEVREAVAAAKSGDVAAKVSPSDEDVIIFEPFEIVHWRMKAGQISAPYGWGILEPARWLFRRLVMFEDSALIYKMTRAPARFAYYVDVGDLPQGQAMGYVNQVKRMFKKQTKWNSGGGGFQSLRYDPMGMNEDIWLPMRAGQETTRVDVLAGPDYQVTDDLEYFRSKLFSALKVPRAYLGFEAEASRQALSQVDVRFAKTVLRVQQAVINGYKEVCRTHLALLGIDPDQVRWELHMMVPSHVFELAQVELMSAKLDIAERLEAWMPKPWVLERIIGLSRDDSEFAVKAKSDENEATLKREAQVNQELAEKYPLGMQGAPPPGTEDEPVPAEEMREALNQGLGRLEKALDAHEGGLSSKLDGLARPVKDLHRDMRFRRQDGSKERGLRRVV